MAEKESSKFNLILGTVSVTGVVLLSFLIGAVTTEFRTFPYPQFLEPSFTALKAQFEKQSRDYSPKGSIWWTRVKHDKQGVETYVPEKTEEGYTVYAGHDTEAYLVNMEGEEVHKWSLPFREAFPDPEHIAEPVEEKGIKWSGAHAFPNGDALVNYTATGDTPYGYGLAKLDKDSNVLWTYEGHVHHDVSINPDGTMWTLTHDFRHTGDDPVEGMPEKFQDTRILEDVAVKLSADGEELRRIPLTEAAVNSPLRDKLAEWHRGKTWDMLHTNNIEAIPADFARHHDFAEPGDLLLSFREISAIALVDPDTERVSWFQNGFWKKQHDPDPLSNGNILIFDNQGYRGPGGMSRVAEYDPSNGEIAWSYSGDEENKFVTRCGGKQVMLPSANVLIAENKRGRVFEVDRNGDVVWEFYNPHRAEQDGNEYMALIGGGIQRLSKDEVRFLP